MKSFIKTLLAGIFTSMAFWGSVSAATYDNSVLEAQRTVMMEEIQNLSGSNQEGDSPVANAHRNAAEELAKRLQLLDKNNG